MGTFEVTVQVSSSDGSQSREFTAMVDTGSTYTLIPGALLAELGIVPLDRAPFELADNSIVEYDVADARIMLGETQRTVPVVFAPEGSSPLLGATALEIFRLAVGPVKQELVPVPLMLK